MVKSWPSEHCLEANKWAIQVLGGYGYTRDYPVERLYRDNRLNHIHEGTFGIQGMDLLGRKVAGDGGKTLARLVDQMRDTATKAARHARLAEPAQRLLGCLERLSTATRTLLDCKDPALRLANATVYLDAFGHIVIGWMWLWQATLAAETLAEPKTFADKRAFYEGKLLACLHFSRHQLPVALVRLDLCGSLDATSLEATAGTFGLGR